MKGGICSTEICINRSPPGETPGRERGAQPKQCAIALYPPSGTVRWPSAPPSVACGDSLQQQRTHCVRQSASPRVPRGEAVRQGDSVNRSSRVSPPLGEMSADRGGVQSKPHAIASPTTSGTVQCWLFPLQSLARQLLSATAHSLRSSVGFASCPPGEAARRGKQSSSPNESLPPGTEWPAPWERGASR